MKPFQTTHEITLRQGDMRRGLHEMAATRPAPAFSVTRLLRSLSHDEPLTGFEREMVDTANANRGTRGELMTTSVLPFSVLDSFARDLNVATLSAGGALVASNPAQAFVAFDGSVAGQVGVRIMPGQRENWVAPKVTTTPPVTWLQLETTAVAEHTPTVGLSATAPRVAGVFVDVSGKLLRQGGPLVDAFLESLLLQAARAALDTAVFAGSGAAGQPLGLINDTSITAQSGTALALAGVLAAQKAVADNVVSDSTARWVGATDVRSTLAARVAFASTASPLWANDRMSGRPALVSNRMPAAGLLYGDFTEVQALLWGAGVEIAVDSYSAFTFDIVRFRVLLTCDVTTPRPGALVRLAAVT